MPVSAWVVLYVTLFIFIGGFIFCFSKMKSKKDE